MKRFEVLPSKRCAFASFSLGASSPIHCYWSFQILACSLSSASVAANGIYSVSKMVLLRGSFYCHFNVTLERFYYVSVSVLTTQIPTGWYNKRTPETKMQNWISGHQIKQGKEVEKRDQLIFIWSQDSVLRRVYIAGIWRDKGWSKKINTLYRSF